MNMFGLQLYGFNSVFGWSGYGCMTVFGLFVYGSITMIGLSGYDVMNMIRLNGYEYMNIIIFNGYGYIYMFGLKVYGYITTSMLLKVCSYLYFWIYVLCLLDGMVMATRQTADTEGSCINPNECWIDQDNKDRTIWGVQGTIHSQSIQVQNQLRLPINIQTHTTQTYIHTFKETLIVELGNVRNYMSLSTLNFPVFQIQNCFNNLIT